MSCKPTSFWLDTETQERLVRLQDELGMSRSQIAREAIRRMAEAEPQAELQRLVAELSRLVLGK